MISEWGVTPLVVKKGGSHPILKSYWKMNHLVPSMWNHREWTTYKHTWTRYRISPIWFQNGVWPPFPNRVVAKIQGGSSHTMISEWGVTPPPPSSTGWFQKIKGGLFPTMISEWRGTPLFSILEKSSPPPNNNDNPNNNNNWDRSMTCRPSAAGKKSFLQLLAGKL